MRPKGVKPQVVGLSVPNVENTMEASAGRLWELVPVVVRWITQLETVLDRRGTVGKARPVRPGLVISVAREGISVWTVLSCKLDKGGVVLRTTDQTTSKAKPQRLESMSFQGMWMSPDPSRRSLVKSLTLFFLN